MRDSFYVVAPEIATVGQSSRAYMQRLLVIAVGLTSCIFSQWNWRRDCRIFKVATTTLPVDNLDRSVISNFTDTLIDIFAEVGKTPTLSVNPLADDEWQEYEYVYFGAHGYRPVDFDLPWNEREECKDYDESAFLELTEDEDAYYAVIKLFQRLSPLFGIIGVVLASVELIFFVFYPSVILGAICLSLAACCELTWLLLFVLDLRYCFSERRCFLDIYFYIYVGIIGGYCFSSVLLMFGIRTYPWLFRHNRNSKKCRVVEATILSQEEIDEQEEKWNAVFGKSNKHKDSEFFGSEGSSLEMGNYSDLKNKLHQTHRKLVQSEKECRDALARAEKAEALLMAYTMNKSTEENVASGRISVTEQVQALLRVSPDKATGVSFEDPSDDELDDAESSEMSSVISDQISVMSEKAEALQLRASMNKVTALIASDSSSEDELDDARISAMFDDLGQTDANDISLADGPSISTGEAPESEMGEKDVETATISTNGAPESEMEKKDVETASISASDAPTESNGEEKDVDTTPISTNDAPAEAKGEEAEKKDVDAAPISTSEAPESKEEK